MSRRTLRLIAGASLTALSLAGCNKQPNATSNGATAEAPPIAALPLAAAVVAPAASAPSANALPPPSRQIRYAPPTPNERYRYIDHAYSMGSAFADTPPDYTVDYQGTRPWIWRASNGAYRIVERLPRGERIYYYDPGQDQPFLVQDPDYSYAYNGEELAGVYGPDGAEINAAIAARRSDQASRYLDRSREMYRAAQYQRRQAAYASEWAARREDLRNQHQMWEEQQARNGDWRAWHDAHQAQETGQWSQERDQRIAYARAIGIPAASSGPLPSPGDLAGRQAAYFANRRAGNGQTPAPNTGAPAKGPAPLPQNRAPIAPTLTKGPAPQPPAVKAQQVSAAVAQARAEQFRALQAAQAQQAAASAKQKEAAAAQMKAAQAAHAQQVAADERKKAMASAQASTAQAAQAQKAAAEAKQKEAAAAQAKAVQAAQAQKAAAEARQKGAAAAQAKAVQAAQAEHASAEARQKEAAAARAKAAQAAQAQQEAAQAHRKEAAAAQAKAAHAAEAQKAIAEAKQHEAAAAQAAAQQAARAPQATGKPGAPTVKEAPKGSKGQREGKKSHQEGQQPQPVSG